MFKVLKDDGYHIAALAPRGDLFGAGVTELCVNEVSRMVASDLHYSTASSRARPTGRRSTLARVAALKPSYP